MRDRYHCNVVSGFCTGEANDNMRTTLFNYCGSDSQNGKLFYVPSSGYCENDVALVCVIRCNTFSKMSVGFKMFCETCMLHSSLFFENSGIDIIIYKCHILCNFIDYLVFSFKYTYDFYVQMSESI